MIQRKLFSLLIGAFVGLACSQMAYADTASQPGAQPDDKKMAAVSITKDQVALFQSLGDVAGVKLQQTLNANLVSLANDVTYLLQDMQKPITIENPFLLFASVHQNQVKNKDGYGQQFVLFNGGLMTRLSQIFFMSSALEVGAFGSNNSTDLFTLGPLKAPKGFGYQQTSQNPAFFGFAISALMVQSWANIEGVVGIRSFVGQSPLSTISAKSDDPKQTELDGMPISKFYLNSIKSSNLSAGYLQLRMFREIQGIDAEGKFLVVPNLQLGFYNFGFSGKKTFSSTKMVTFSVGGKVQYQLNPKMSVFAQANLNGNVLSPSFGDKITALGYQVQVGGVYEINPNTHAKLDFNQYGANIDGIRGYQAGVSVEFMY